MARTQEETPFYIRTQEGDTFFVDTLEEALEQFLGDKGYRLTLITEDNEMVIRRGLEWTPGLLDVERNCHATIAHRKK